MRSALRIAAMLLASVTLACASFPKDFRPGCLQLFWTPLLVPGYPIARKECPAPCEFRAGASEVDITPPPGFPMGGSGPAGRFGRGYWTRLMARAFFFRDTEGRPLVLVSCDLAAVSAGLQREVGWRLHQKHLDLTPENLVLSATHVHQGPGNFMTYNLYNKQGSPAAGWDAHLFDWLAERISCAILEAKARAEEVPPEVTTELVVRTGAVAELLRNRAPEPFMLNPDRDEILSRVPSPGRCPGPYRRDCPRFRAVDNRLTVVEIQRWDGVRRTIAASLVFLAVHPEAMSHETELYQSDFTGLAMFVLEKRDGRVAGFFNGADGDISVRWKHQNRSEALRFSASLVQAIDAASETARDSDPKITVARKEIIANPYFVNAEYRRRGYCIDPAKGPCLAEEPVFGVAAAGGAEDARTPLFDLGWKPGVRGLPTDDQGVKVPAFTSVLFPKLKFTRLVATFCDYPERIPLGLVELKGPMVQISFAILPAELTTTAWYRIEKELMPDIGQVVPVGLANEYVSYVTTLEEYAAQGYEGASDEFGSGTAAVFLDELCDLTHDLGSPQTRVESAAFFPGPALSDADSFRPDSLGYLHGSADEALEPLLTDENGDPGKLWPRFEWTEKIEKIDDWKGANRSIQILESSAHCTKPIQPAEDEKDGNLLTVFINRSDAGSPPPTLLRIGSTGSPVERPPLKTGDERCWTAIWIPPSTTDVDRCFQFSVRLADGSLAASDPFTLRDAMTQFHGPIPPLTKCGLRRVEPAPPPDP
jgi:neutral ceramidase